MPGGAPSQAPPTPAVTRAPAEDPVASVPEWRKGDRWVYDWTSGTERGTRTVEVAGLQTVNTIDFYVVDVGPTSQQYYTKDLHFAASVQASRVLARMVPPQPWFVWPLKIGARWDYRGVYEEQKTSRPENDSFVVAGIEQVTVPLGTFRAYKLVRQTDRSDGDQYWYAPEARWYVRWTGRRGDMDFEEVLKMYQPAARGR
jgi:hypothetical protein